MHVNLGTIKGLPKPKLRKMTDAFLVTLRDIQTLGLELDDSEYFEQGALLDSSMPEHQRLIQQVQALGEEPTRGRALQ